MCGITGFWSSAKAALPSEKIIRQMTDVLGHRGPDRSGTWIESQAGLALGHRRLSIMDLSSAGDQPMVSACGRYHMVFNGEIYNHTAIRRDLEAAHAHTQWRGHSDTETLLEAFAHWGIEQTLRRANGMFAIALWDQKSRTLILARDRFGEKPLYYGLQNSVLLFGSELKALRKHPAFVGEIDRAALALYLAKNNVPCPHSIYRDIYKLPPAHWIEVTEPLAPLPAPACYWDLRDIARQGLENSLPGNATALADRLDTLMNSAVALRMEADVPVGAFLSGGYDSSLIAALMQKHSVPRIKTFTIGFEEAGFNEAPYAEKVAKHLGTDHTALYITGQEALDVVPKLPEIWDEPFADSSQIPTYLLSHLTRQSVTVSLSGDGADEIFGGYNRYRSTPKIWERINALAPWGRKSLAWSAQSLSSGLGGFAKISDDLRKIGDYLSQPSFMNLYRYKTSHWKNPAEIVLGVNESVKEELCITPLIGVGKILDQIMMQDMTEYLPDDILPKVDRASMAVSLEARIPFLDPAVVAFSWGLKSDMKIKNGQGKWLLRQVVHRHVPKVLMERPKQGFSVPIEAWLRGPLKEWGEDLLNESRLRRDGFFDPQPIRAMWEAFQKGAPRRHKPLWDILVFQAWRDHIL